ncbi:MAG: hypothetical protein U0994_01115 [Gemmatimonadales bacterium]|nr:hypothetical protein [Gemmatimonadales bacterium]
MRDLCPACSQPQATANAEDPDPEDRENQRRQEGGLDYIELGPREREEDDENRCGRTFHRLEDGMSLFLASKVHRHEAGHQQGQQHLDVQQ